MEKKLLHWQWLEQKLRKWRHKTQETDQADKQNGWKKDGEI